MSKFPLFMVGCLIVVWLVAEAAFIAEHERRVRAERHLHLCMDELYDYKGGPFILHEHMDGGE